MSPFCRVTLGDESCVTDSSTGNCPQWNKEFIFNEMTQTSLKLSVQHKAMLFKPTEVGYCIVKLPLKDFKRNMSFELKNKEESVGKVFVGICIYKQETEQYYENKVDELSKNDSDYASDINDTEIILMKRKVAEQNNCSVY
jgi:hypothetical protein